MQVRVTGNEEINRLCWEWFKEASARRLPISRAILQEKSLRYAKELGCYEFKASNGWLESFWKRHNIGGRIVSDVAANVNQEEWFTRLSTICADYRPEDIYTMGETGLVYKPSQDGTLHSKEEMCREGGKAEERLTISMCLNMAGEKETLVVIGSSLKPRCFKNIDVGTLPVTYRSSVKAWMNTSLFEEWLLSFNSEMRQQGRKVILFVNSCAAHPNLSMDSVKLVFFPPSLDPHFQPLEERVVYMLKLNYRKRQLRNMLGMMDSGHCTFQLDRSISELDAIYWIHKSWEEIEPLNVQKTFARCRFPSEFEPDVPMSVDNTEVGLDDLCQDVYQMSVSELASLDSGVAMYNTCDNWEDEIIEAARRVTMVTNHVETLENELDSDEELELTVIPGESCMQQVVSHIEGLKDFCLHKGWSDTLDLLFQLQDSIEKKNSDSKTHPNSFIHS